MFNSYENKSITSSSENKSRIIKSPSKEEKLDGKIKNIKKIKNKNKGKK